MKGRSLKVQKFLEGHKIWKNLLVWSDVKGVSDLEMCVDYFALPGRSCESLKFPCQKNLATSQTTKNF